MWMFIIIYASHPHDECVEESDCLYFIPPVIITMCYVQIIEVA